MLEKITESLKGTVGGAVLLIASFPVLFNNEGCAVDIAKGLEEGASIVQTIDATKDIASYNGKLIHTSGEAVAGAKLNDPEFGIDEKALVLERDTEIYQWEESVSEDDSKKPSKTYTYSKKWAWKHIDSSKFNDPKGHFNPPQQFEPKTFRPDSVSLGKLKFSEELIGSIPANKDLSYDQSTTNRIKSKFGSKAQIQDGTIYVGKNPADPEVGDMKITHKYAMEGTSSIIGLLNGDSVNSYRTKRDTTILMFDFGTKDAKSMFQDAQDANVTRTWMVRFLGVFMMFLGFRLIFGPIAAVGGMIPILGTILDLGVSLVAGILTISFSLVTIAVAWIFFRPILGITLLVIGIGAFGYLYYKKNHLKTT
ncbi:TMEM43 family protein [Leptospira sp. 96542]|nr:TMEM43 family protein [Leptospira sp. 96542]